MRSQKRLPIERTPPAPTQAASPSDPALSRRDLLTLGTAGTLAAAVGIIHAAPAAAGEEKLSGSPPAATDDVYPWKLAHTNYGEVKQRRYEVAVMPIGATEEHNLHLPYSTDTLTVTALGEKICEGANRRGAKVMLLPTIPFGTQTNHMKFPFAMNLYPSTLCTIFSDLAESLVRTGLRKIVILNGHGGNELKGVLRELYGRTPAYLFLCNWWEACGDIHTQLFKESPGHADAAETSTMLALCPELVARNPDGTLKADQGQVTPSRFEAVNRDWVTLARPWHLVTTNSGYGNPHGATAEKGRQLLATAVERLVPFLVELSASKLDERFPY